MELKPNSALDVIQRFSNFERIHSIRIKYDEPIPCELIAALKKLSHMPQIILGPYHNSYSHPRNTQKEDFKDSANLKLILENFPSISLKFTGIKKFSNDSLELLSKSDSIYSLEFAGVELDNETMESIKKIKLRQLIIDSGDPYQDDYTDDNYTSENPLEKMLSSDLPTFENLQELTLRRVPIPSNNLSFLSPLLSLKKLSLDSCFCHFRKPFILPKNTSQLEELYIENCLGTINTKTFETLPSYPSLTVLKIDSSVDSNLNSEDLESLACNSHLKILALPLGDDFSNCSFSFLESLINLEELELRDSRKIPNDIFEHLLYSPKLRTLTLKDSYFINDEGLALLPLLGSLEVLNLENLYFITPQGLSPLHLHSNIKTISIKKCERFPGNLKILRGKSNNLMYKYTFSNEKDDDE